uniref:Progestin and adipoQ receptor family member VIII n=1 Tax=Xenopus tropicalis TaxID=8364 RepID=A0A1B8YB31_XENTR
MTTAILECISTLSISVQQLRRLPRFLEGGTTKMPLTVKDSDVPRLFREPYIQTGYRPTDQDWKYYFLSLFQKHNESINVWTHLLVALAVVLRFVALVQHPGSSAPVQVRAGSLHLLLHGLCRSKHLPIWQCFGPLLLHSNQAWYDKAWYFFLPGAAFLGWMSCAGCCYAKYCYKRPYPVMRKIFQVVPAGLAYMLDISPVIHRIVTCHMEGCTDKAIWVHALQIIFFLISSYFFSCPVPEKYFPGSCDFVGHGHQIFHVFLGLCTLSQLEALFIDYQTRHELFSLRYSSNGTLVNCLSFFMLILCSTGTAMYARRRIKNKLARKEL